MIETKPRLKKKCNRIVDSCFELVGSQRQHSVEQQKVEQPPRVSCLPNTRGNDYGWATVAFFDSRFGLYHVAVVLSFLRSQNSLVVI